MTVSERVTRKDIDELRQWFAADAGPDVTRSSYGDVKRQRLRELKREWDPTNVFRLNHNIEPEDG